MIDKIGVGITTCNRPDFFNQCIESIDLEKVDWVVIVNDGDPFDYIPKSLKIIFIQNETNLGVSKSKNKIFRRLISLKCDHIFTMEDDCIITDNNVFDKYITASYITGLKHFNFGPASPWNRKQEDNSIIGDLSKRHLARQDAEPNPVLVVKYNDEISISLYEHIVAMFCYFRTSLIEEVGTMNEDFYNAWEHVEHTFRIIKSGNYSPFWAFADITGSENYLKEAKDEKAKTSLAKDEETYMKQVHDGLAVFYKEHQIVPSMIPPSTEYDIKAVLKKIYANVISKDSLIIHDRISQTQHIPEFEILLQTYKDLKPKIILEIGSYMGWSLHHWIKYAEEGAIVISIDLPIAEFCGAQDPRCKQQEEAIANEWKSWTKEKNIKLYLIRSSSQLQTTVDAVKELLNGEELDFIFIDGDHRYEAVRKDFELYFPLVRKFGVIALHDIGYAEEGGVHKLWDELVKDNRVTTKPLRLHPKKEKGIGIICKKPL